MDITQYWVKVVYTWASQDGNLETSKTIPVYGYNEHHAASRAGRLIRGLHGVHEVRSTETLREFPQFTDG